MVVVVSWLVVVVVVEAAGIAWLSEMVAGEVVSLIDSLVKLVRLLSAV